MKQRRWQAWAHNIARARSGCKRWRQKAEQAQYQPAIIKPSPMMSIPKMKSRYIRTIDCGKVSNGVGCCPDHDFLRGMVALSMSKYYKYRFGQMKMAFKSIARRAGLFTRWLVNVIKPYRSRVASWLRVTFTHDGASHKTCWTVSLNECGASTQVFISSLYITFGCRKHAYIKK